MRHEPKKSKCKRGRKEGEKLKKMKGKIIEEIEEKERKRKRNK